MQFLRALLPRRPGSHRILSGSLRGMRIHTSWHSYPRAILGVAEKQLCRWIEDHVGAGETWIDVGAHHGVTALALSRCVGKGGRVFAFEPVLESAGLLAKTRQVNALSQLTVIPMALGDVDELSALRTSGPSRGMVGIIPAMRDGRWAGEGDVVFEIAFDRIWPRLCGEHSLVNGVKIDVQGAESYVLRGMRETLEAYRPRLIVEYHGYADLPEFRRALERVGYSSVGHDIDNPSSPKTADLEDGHNYEFACLGVPAEG